MQVSVNGELVSLTVFRLDEIVAELGYGEKKVAVAVNEMFVAKANWTSHVVSAGDRLDVVSAISGG